MSSLVRGGRRALVVVSLVLFAVLAPVAVAAAAKGPKPLKPRQGKHFAVGSRIRFKVRDRSHNARKYHVFLVVSSKKHLKHGELQPPKGDAPGDQATMKRHRHGVFTYRPPHYTFPSWYMQRPGRYYWQAFHIDCGVGRPKDCHITGRLHSFRVG